MDTDMAASVRQLNKVGKTIFALFQTFFYFYYIQIIRLERKFLKGTFHPTKIRRCRNNNFIKMII